VATPSLIVFLAVPFGAATADQSLTPVVMYITPDQVLPLTSVLGAIAGILLMFWNRVRVFVGKIWNRLSGGGR